MIDRCISHRDREESPGLIIILNLYFQSILLNELHVRDTSIMNDILERERKAFESECGITDSASKKL